MKYQKVNGHWNYCFIMPDGMFYIGESGKKYCSTRWSQTQYKNTVVQPYIEKYGWENIRKVVLKDGLTEEQALQLEDLLIQEARKGGWCINRLRSGGNRKEKWETENKDRRKEYRRLYYQEYREKNREKYNEYMRKYHKKNFVK